MFARGPQPGYSPKTEALKRLPEGTRCTQAQAMGIRGYVVELPDGRCIASAGSAREAWMKAEAWAEHDGASRYHKNGR